MKWLILALIQAYWRRPNKPQIQRCHFKETCSGYVYRITQEQGFIAGLKAFKQRFYQCRSGYAIIEIDTTEYIILSDKTIIERTETIL